MANSTNNLDKALESIRTFSRDLPSESELQDRLSTAKGFYMLEEEGKEPMFANAQFVRRGVVYDGPFDRLTRHYLNNSMKAPAFKLCRESDLEDYFERVEEDCDDGSENPEYPELYLKLARWMQPYPKDPQNRVTIFRPK